jgi:parallel beta-helix repeat protein
VEDNGRTGISFEVSNGATIRTNTLRRNAADAVLISVSENAEIYKNSVEANFGGIQYFLNCASLSEGFDLQSNATYENTVVIGTQSNTYANGFSYTFSSCTSAQLAPYLNGSKNLTFSRNTYSVPSTTAQYWIWGMRLPWGQWQSIGHDVEGVVSQVNGSRSR